MATPSPFSQRRGEPTWLSSNTLLFGWPKLISPSRRLLAGLLRKDLGFSLKFLFANWRPLKELSLNDKPALDLNPSRAFRILIVGAATVAAGGCLAWERETKPGGVAPLQFVRRAIKPVEHLR